MAKSATQLWGGGVAEASGSDACSRPAEEQHQRPAVQRRRLRCVHVLPACGACKRPLPRRHAATRPAHLPHMVAQQHSVQAAVDPVPRQQQQCGQGRLAAVLWENHPVDVACRAGMKQRVG